MKRATLLEEANEKSKMPAGVARWRLRRRDGKGKPVVSVAHTAFEAYRQDCSKLNVDDGIPAFNAVDIEQIEEVKPTPQKKPKKKRAAKKPAAKSKRPAARRTQTRKRRA